MNPDELVKATSFFDFITVDLYSDNENGYTPNVGMEYYIYSERHKTYQQYVITEGTKYDELKSYIKKGLLYVTKKNKTGV